MKNSMIAVALLALSATVAYAGPQEGGDAAASSARQMRPDATSKLVERVNLTEQQKQQIAEVRQSTLEENAKFFETSERTLDELQAAREANDEARIDSLKQMVESQRQELKDIREAELSRILRLLTREQRAQFEELRAAREARKKEHQAKH